MPIVVTNTGTAPAEEVELSGTAPNGWKIDLRAEDHRPHRAEPEQGSAGADHADRQGDRRRLCHRVRASARGESASPIFRVTVTTSTMWGIAGAGIIGVALLVMVGAVARFGRR